MDFEEIWQTHKRFILIVSAGALGLLLVWLGAEDSLLGAGFGYRARLTSAVADIDGLQGTLSNTGRPHERDVRWAEERRETMASALMAVRERILFRPRPAFVPPASGTDPDVFYNERVQAVQAGVGRMAAVQGVRVAGDLGLSRVTPRGVREIEWYLRALDAVERIVTLAIVAGVQSVVRIDVEAPVETRRDGRGVELPFESQGITIVVRGHPSTVDSLVRGVPDVPSSGLGDLDPALLRGFDANGLLVQQAAVQSLDSAQGAVGQGLAQSVEARFRVELAVPRPGAAETGEGRR